jgi:hypothetical protein
MPRKCPELQNTRNIREELRYASRRYPASQKKDWSLDQVLTKAQRKNPKYGLKNAQRNNSTVVCSNEGVVLKFEKTFQVPGNLSQQCRLSTRTIADLYFFLTQRLEDNEQAMETFSSSKGIQKYPKGTRQTGQADEKSRKKKAKGKHQKSSQKVQQMEMKELNSMPKVNKEIKMSERVEKNTIPVEEMKSLPNVDRNEKLKEHISQGVQKEGKKKTRREKKEAKLLSNAEKNEQFKGHTKSQGMEQNIAVEEMKSLPNVDRNEKLKQHISQGVQKEGKKKTRREKKEAKLLSNAEKNEQFKGHMKSQGMEQNIAVEEMKSLPNVEKKRAIETTHIARSGEKHSSL